MFFFAFRREADNAEVICNKASVRFVESWPEGPGVKMLIVGMGVVYTKTYDLAGFGASVADLDDERFASFLEDAA